MGERIHVTSRSGASLAFTPRSALNQEEGAVSVHFLGQDFVLSILQLAFWMRRSAKPQGRKVQSRGPVDELKKKMHIAYMSGLISSGELE